MPRSSALHPCLHRRLPLSGAAALMLLLTAFVPALPRTSSAYGPGMHILEADRVLADLSATDPAWAELAAHPEALTWLHLGCIAPDFQWASDTISFGHSRALGFALLDAAETPEQRLFALGHVCHMASDAAAETFLLPTLFGSAPLGMFDLFDNRRGAMGASEGIVEGFGDLVTGDWAGLVDLLYDLWFEPGVDRERGLSMVRWYCGLGAAHAGRQVDCDQAALEVGEILGMAEQLLGDMDRDAAHMLVAGLVEQPLEQTAVLFSSGILTSVVGQQGTPSDAMDWEIERFIASPLCDREFWAQYDDLDELGPSFALDRLAAGGALGGFPGWDEQAIVCGNLQSVMQFDPAAYAVVAGLLVDRVEWLDEQGQPLASLTRADDGRALSVRLRMFSTLPFDGPVRGVVRRDRPGLDRAGDDVLGEATLELVYEPTAAAQVPRPTLEVPFVARTAEALGFVVELHAADDPRPTFTSSWDGLLRLPQPELDRAIYRDNFGTYGHWPPSLPVLDPLPGPATLLVKARVAPAGPGVAGAQVLLDRMDLPALAPPNGITIFDGLEPGDWVASAEAPGYRAGDPVAATLSPLEQRWVWLDLHPIPTATPAPLFVADAGCTTLTWDPGPFGFQVDKLLVEVLPLPGEEPLAGPTELGAAHGRGQLCPPPRQAHGQGLPIRLQTRYTDDSLGAVGFADAPVTVDNSPPQVGDPTVFAAPSTECVPEGELLPWTPPLLVEVEITEPHSPLASLQWRLGEQGEWAEAPAWVPLGRPSAAPQRARFRVEVGHNPSGAQLSLRVRNAAGGEALSAWTDVPLWGDHRLCRAADPDLGVGDPDGGSSPDGGAEVDLGPAPDEDAGSPDGGVRPDAAQPEHDTGAPEPDADPGGGSGGGGTADESGCAVASTTEIRPRLGSLLATPQDLWRGPLVRFLTRRR